jgi:uncharacterized membrane protein
MVSIVGAAVAAPIREGPPSGAELRITVRPNHAGREREGVVALAIASAIAVVVGYTFASMGAWPVAAIAALAPAGVAAALLHLHRHGSDFERITLGRRNLTVDRRVGRDIEHFAFSPFWVHVVGHAAPSGGLDYLALSAHGHEVRLGKDLTDLERAEVEALLQSSLPRLET